MLNAQRDAARDPISRMQMFLIREGILDEKGINRLEKEVDDSLQAAVDQAIAAPVAPPESIKTIFVFAGPRSDIFCFLTRKSPPLSSLCKRRNPRQKPWRT